MPKPKKIGKCYLGLCYLFDGNDVVPMLFHKCQILHINILLVKSFVSGGLVIVKTSSKGKKRGGGGGRRSGLSHLPIYLHFSSKIDEYNLWINIFSTVYNYF